MFVSCKCYVLSGRGLCVGPILLPEEPYRVSVSVSVCVIECEKCNINPLHPAQIGRKTSE